MNDCESHGPDSPNRSAGSPMGPPAQGVPSAGSRASTQEGLLSGLQPDCPGERRRVVSTFQTVTCRSELSHLAPMWRGVLCRAWGSSPREQTYHLRLTGSLHGHAVGSGRPLGPRASLLPCYKLLTSCFVPGKSQLDPRGMRHVPQHKDIARQRRTPLPSASLPPPPSPTGPRGASCGGGGRNRTTAPPGLHMLPT